MRRTARYIILTVLLFCGVLAHAQNRSGNNDNRNNLIAAKDKLILLIDINSPLKDIDTIFKKAGIIGVNARAFVKGDFDAVIKQGWKLTKQQGNIAEFNRSLNSIKVNPQLNPYVITVNAIRTNNRHGYMDNALYGVNKFTNVSVYELPSGLTRFILPGYLKARRAFLSGGFNDWSTLKGLMKKTADGWVIDIKLQPGAWMYKFIVDGQWIDDPNNMIQLDDGGGNVNSVYYKYTYTFKLAGYASAHTVTVSGSFNDMRSDELVMQRKGDTWELPLYLHDGMHTYRFMVDGKWIPDPVNPDKYVAGDANITSILNIGETVYFKLKGYADAGNVSVAGNFNKWKENKIKLKKTGDGWLAPVILPAGNYTYKFIVDGQWILDPANQNQVVEGGQLNSFIAVKPNYTFKLKGYDNAKRIIVSGSFNKWSEDSYTMAHNGDEWTISVRLKPGKILYKFIVDGNWILDPGNKQWEQNEYDTGNSVLWVEQ